MPRVELYPFPLPNSYFEALLQIWLYKIISMGPLSDEVMPLGKKRQQHSPSPCKDTEKAAVCIIGSWVSFHLSFGLPRTLPELWENRSLLLKLSKVWDFSLIAHADKYKNLDCFLFFDWLAMNIETINNSSRSNKSEKAAAMWVIKKMCSS